jgi:hypothetical protein
MKNETEARRGPTAPAWLGLGGRTRDPLGLGGTGGSNDVLRSGQRTAAVPLRGALAMREVHWSWLAFHIVLMGSCMRWLSFRPALRPQVVPFAGGELSGRLDRLPL